MDALPTIQPAVAASWPWAAVKVHCLVHMRTACSSGPPFCTSMSVAMVTVRRPVAGQRAISSASTVSLGFSPSPAASCLLEYTFVFNKLLMVI